MLKSRWICRILVLGLLVFLTPGLFAAGNKEKPEFPGLTSGPQYLSPNGDGIQDEAVLKFSVKLFVKSDAGYVPEYGMRITGADGSVVKEIVENETADINWFIQLFRSYKEFTLEKSIQWDGKDLEGNVVSDGTYEVLIWVVDANKNRTEVPIDSFVVDTVPPEPVISQEKGLIFSPNGDNRLDGYEVFQLGEDICQWRGEILDSDGTIVRVLGRRFDEPPYGEPAVDATEMDGVEATEMTDAEPIEAEAPDAGDDTAETVEADDSGEPSVVMAAPEETDDPDFTETEKECGLDPMIWDGLDDAGAPAPEGFYTYYWRGLDRAGNPGPEFLSEPFELKTTETPVEMTLASMAFSPDGDGIHDELVVRLNHEVTEGVTGWWFFVNSNNQMVYEESGDTEVPEEIRFDGRNNDGELLAEGPYEISYVVEYAHGNRPVLTDVTALDVTDPTVTVDADRNAFSPDGDGVKDTLEIRFDADEKVIWQAKILDAEGTEVLSRTSEETTNLIVWDGKDVEGNVLPDGDYRFEVLFSDGAGNRLEAEETLTIDTAPVTLVLDAAPGFSPNGDGYGDDMVFDVEASQYDQVTSWALTVNDEDGNPVALLNGVDTLPEVISWNGEATVNVTEEADLSVPVDGTYSASLSVIFDKGKSAEADSETFIVDLNPPTVDLAVTSNPFAKTDEGLEGEMFISLVAEDDNGIVSWDLDILDKDGHVVRSYSGDGDPSDQIAWNGDKNTGGRVPAADEFDLVVRVRDTGGSETVFKRPVPLDVLVVKRDGKFYLMVPNIIFGAYKSSLDSAGAAQGRENRSSLDRVVSIYGRYPGYSLGLEAYALNVYRKGTAKWAAEEKVLGPLTERRAASVKSALEERGMDADLIETRAFGGEYPIVSTSDSKVWWKNRRVEFVMKKQAE